MSDDGYEGVSKLSTEFKRLADIDIFDAEGQLRDTYDILEDMAEVFPTLNKNTQQYLSELAAGKRQVNVLQSLLMNWQSVDKAVLAATNSLGSAEAENSKFMNSIQGKLNQLDSAWQKLSQKTIGSGFLKTMVEAGTSMLKFTDATGGLVPVLGLISGLLVAKFLPSILKTSIGFKNLIQETLVGIGIFREARTSGMSLGDSFKYAGLGASSAQLAIAGLTIVITGIIMAVNAHNQAMEENRRKAEEYTQSQIELEKTLKEQISTYEDLIKKREEASTPEETASINEDLLDLQKQIRKELGKESESLDLINGQYQEQSDILQGILKQKQKGNIESLKAAKILAEEAKSKAFTSDDSFFGVDQFGVIARQLKEAGTGFSGSLDIFYETIQTKPFEEQISVLEDWQVALNDAALEGKDVGDAVAFVAAKLDSLKTAEQNAKNATDALNQALAEVGLEEFGTQSVKSQQDFDNLIKQIENSQDIKVGDLGLEESKKLLLEAAYSLFPQFATAVEEATGTIRDQYDKIGILTDEYGNYSVELEGLTMEQRKAAISALDFEMALLALQREQAIASGATQEQTDAYNEQINALKEIKESVMDVSGVYSDLYSQLSGLDPLGDLPDLFDLISQKMREGKTASEEFQNAVANIVSPDLIFGTEEWTNKFSELHRVIDGGIPSMINWLEKNGALTRSFVDGKEAIAINIESIEDFAKSTNSSEAFVLTLLNTLSEVVPIDFTHPVDSMTDLDSAAQGVDDTAQTLASDLSSLPEVGDLGFIALKTMIDNAILSVQNLSTAISNTPSIPGGASTASPNQGSTSGSKARGKHDGTTSFEGGKALVGEFAPELVILPDGTEYLVGKNGPEIVNIPKGAAIIPGNLTSEVETKGIPNFASGYGWSPGPSSSSSNKSVTGATGGGTYRGGSSSTKKTSKSSSVPAAASSAGGGGTSSSKSEDLWKKEFEDKYKALQHQLKMEEISERQYTETLDALYKQYFENRSEYLEEYSKYEEEVYSNLKKLHKEEFDEQYEKLQHSLKMNEITESDYTNQLENLYKKYFENRKGFEKEFNKYEEEVYANRKKIFDDEIKYIEHTIDLVSKRRGTERQQIEMFSQLQQKIQSQINYYYAQGLDDNHEYIQELKKQWLGYQDSIENINKNIYGVGMKVAVAVIQDEIKLIEDRNKALEEQKKVLQDTNEEQNRAIELQKLQDTLYNAKTQKTIREYREGIGFVWTTNKEAIKDAQKALDDFNVDTQVREIDKQIDANNKNIESWQELEDAWNSIVSDYEMAQDKLSAALLFGSDFEKNVLQGRLDYVRYFAKEYTNSLEGINYGVEEFLSYQQKSGAMLGEKSTSSLLIHAYADGTTNASGGISVVGEEGAEIRVLNPGDGVIPADGTQNLMKWSNYNPNDFMKFMNNYPTFSSKYPESSNITKYDFSNFQIIANNPLELFEGLKQYAAVHSGGR